MVEREEKGVEGGKEGKRERRKERTKERTKEEEEKMTEEGKGRGKKGGSKGRGKYYCVETSTPVSPLKPSNTLYTQTYWRPRFTLSLRQQSSKVYLWLYT